WVNSTTGKSWAAASATARVAALPKPTHIIPSGERQIRPRNRMTKGNAIDPQAVITQTGTQGIQRNGSGGLLGSRSIGSQCASAMATKLNATTARSVSRRDRECAQRLASGRAGYFSVDLLRHQARPAA